MLTGFCHKQGQHEPMCHPIRKHVASDINFFPVSVSQGCSNTNHHKLGKTAEICLRAVLEARCPKSRYQQGPALIWSVPFSSPLGLPAVFGIPCFAAAELYHPSSLSHGVLSVSSYHFLYNRPLLSTALLSAVSVTQSIVV